MSVFALQCFVKQICAFTQKNIPRCCKNSRGCLFRSRMENGRAVRFQKVSREKSDHQTGPWDPMMDKNMEGVQPGVVIMELGVCPIEKEHFETL